MKNVVLILISVFVVWVVFNMIKALLFTTLHIALQLAIVALFCYAVYAVYKLLTRQKVM